MIAKASQPLYTAVQVRELDRLAINAGIPGYTLMTRAGEAIWHMIKTNFPAINTLVVVCGTGNNGGDGYVVARLGRAAGIDVRVLQLGDSSKISGDALMARDAWLAVSGSVEAFDIRALAGVDLIVDAMLGTGIERPLEGEWLTAVEAINATCCPVVAVDIPTGLHADTGAVLGGAIKADWTVTFIGRKQGLYTGQARNHVGQIYFEDLQVPDTVKTQVMHEVERLGSDALPDMLGELSRPRLPAAHKGDFGHVLVVGGEQGMAGAALLAGEAALRVGAGRVSLATRPEHAMQLTAARPELMCHGVADASDLQSLAESADVIVIGPGLGRTGWAQQLLSVVLQGRWPLVVDADALNLLADDPVARGNWVVTPHPGEAGRLLQQSSAEVQSDRFAAIRALHGLLGGTVILKGAGTLVTSADEPVSVCDVGCAGLATAGSGDVLSGVIAGLIAQGLSLSRAACAGVLVHGLAGEQAARAGERGMLASDVIAALRAVMNPDSR